MCAHVSRGPRSGSGSSLPGSDWVLRRAGRRDAGFHRDFPPLDGHAKELEKSALKLEPRQKVQDSKGSPPAQLVCLLHGQARVCRERIINIWSQHGHISAPEDFAYGVSKAGVAYMTRQIAADYDSRNIVCNAVAPGKILTGKGGRAVEQRWLDYSTARTPWPRLGTPIDVANAALFLASDEATFLTGHNLFVDGGWMAA
ncbi:SDR family oxidoreductase [Palleronia sp.]|uniref:SDR family oxidoreductase n=1 Tax=Palleronia sp. TaxID=1940284 RepID=UPI0035C874EF